jgi:predicted double-glycine peptidase
MRRASRLGVLCLPALLLQACATPGAPASLSATTIRGGMVRGVAPVVSWRELRDRNVVRQGFDYSCGAAALATLMRYYFGDDVSEEAILVDILRSMPLGDVQDREANGLSLLDLRLQAERMGYQATGVRLGVASLPALQGPVVVHLERADYRHFAVLRGVRGDRVYLADPSQGNLRLSVDRFVEEWSGVALVLGKPGFGLPQSHPLALEDPDPGPHEAQAARQSLFAR